MQRIMQRATKILALSLALLSAAACSYFESKPTPQPTPPLTAQERDVHIARNALVLHVFLITRTDGGVLTAEDRAFINQNKPLETQLVLLSDDNRQATLGMNIEFPPAQLQALQSRFNVREDTNR